MNIGLDRAVKAAIKSIERQAQGRVVKASNELRNAAMEVLANGAKGTAMKTTRKGRTYRKPHTKRAVYRASAPGEPPALRSGTLRGSWRSTAETHGSEYKAVITSGVKYAPYLEAGTEKMAARPFVEKIIETAKPRIEAIFKEPWN